MRGTCRQSKSPLRATSKHGLTAVGLAASLRVIKREGQPDLLAARPCYGVIRAMAFGTFEGALALPPKRRTVMRGVRHGER